MRWTAIVPLKAKGERKSRLGERLSMSRRVGLSEQMFAHVTDTLGRHPAVDRVIVLADKPPPGWTGSWVADRGRGLNAELDAARAEICGGGLVLLHADLPLLENGDITALLEAAEARGIGIAPDRHGNGTNALAMIEGQMLGFRFGADSFHRHREQVPDCAVVRRLGLELDVDTPADLDMVMSKLPQFAF
jgi:2-phospho-L-lactate guanylyltransferase